MIVFAHTNFGLVRIQGSRVKRGGGGGRSPPLRSERVFQIPVQIVLNNSVVYNLKYMIDLLLSAKSNSCFI